MMNRPLFALGLAAAGAFLFGRRSGYSAGFLDGGTHVAARALTLATSRS